MIDGCSSSCWKDGVLPSKGRSIVLDHRKQRRYAVLCVEKAVRVPMEVGDNAGKLWHGSERQTPLLGHVVQKLRLVEPAHDKHPIDNFTLTRNIKCLIVIDSYRDNF